MKKVNITFRRQLAGFFDAEGCVSVYKSSLSVRLIVGQTKPAVLYHIQKVVGIGCVKETSQEVYLFEVKDKESEIAFIKLILPYSLVKRRQMELALQLLDLVGASGIHITKENRKKRIALAEEITALKYKDYIPRSSDKVSPAYICGFWEGDGSVCCRSNYSPRIQIKQKFPNVLYIIQKHLKFGRVKPCNSDNQYFFNIRDKTNLQKFIRLVRPYVLIKRRHLDIASQLTKLITSGGKSLTAENLRQRKTLARCLRKLNS